jgi:hypothetical protein
LSLGFSVWARNLLPFTAISALVHAPLIVYTVLLLGKGQPETPEEAEVFSDAWTRWSIVVPVGSVLLSLIATGALTYGVVQQLRGQRASFGSCVTVGLARLPAILGVGVLVALCVGLGFLLLIVPGIILFCMLWVAVPVAVIERPGIRASLSRSAELTRGARGPIFLVLLVLGVLGKVLSLVIEAVFFRPPEWENLKTYLVVEFLIGVVAMGSLQATVNAVGYWQLRSSREGATIEDLAKVFD